MQIYTFLPIPCKKSGFFSYFYTPEIMDSGASLQGRPDPSNI
jgi:hypothetical protein